MHDIKNIWFPIFIKNKLAVGRHKDLADIESLE
jgi:hypothetical protein